MVTARRISAAALVLMAVVAAGCGSAQRTPVVQITVTAPVDGASVGVPAILVLGKVSPASAALRVQGRRVRARRGSFSVPLRLDRRVTRIRITAGASGYEPAEADVLVSYRPGPRAVATRAGSASSDSPVMQLVNAEFLSSCAATARINACACAWRYLVAHGVNSMSSWRSLSAAWLRWVQAGATGPRPALMTRAVDACRHA